MKRVAALLICLTLGSCLGCAPQKDQPRGITVHRSVTNCPDPAPLDLDALPDVDHSLPFDSPENTDVLTARHLIIKAHIKELTAALACYREQSQ